MTRNTSAQPWFMALSAVIYLAACNDPNDPKTWIRRLRDPEHANEAVRRLHKLGDPAAVEPLCALFKEYPSPTILTAIISFNDKRSISTLISALEFDGDDYHNATLAAKALASLKAASAVKPLTKLLEKPLPIKSRANLAKLAAIEALADIGDTSAVEPLIKVAEGRPERQDFYLNKRAIVALGKLGDPKAIPVLINSLFMASTLQGSSFTEARVALVRIGQPAIEPLMKSIRGKNAALNKLAEELEFKKGVLHSKIAIVLADLGAKPIVPWLLTKLQSTDVTTDAPIDGLIEALGRSKDAQALPPLVNIVTNSSAHYRLRMQACAALSILGLPDAAPSLLEVVKAEPNEKPAPDSKAWSVKQAAIAAFSRIAISDAADGLAVLNKLASSKAVSADARAKELLADAKLRLETAKRCKHDVQCYATILSNTSSQLPALEKAGIAIGGLRDGRKALGALIKALPRRDPIVREYLLESAKRLGTPKDKELIKAVATLARKDSKRKKRFSGANLASLDHIALAVLKNK